MPRWELHAQYLTSLIRSYAILILNAYWIKTSVKIHSSLEPPTEGTKMYVHIIQVSVLQIMQLSLNMYDMNFGPVELSQDGQVIRVYIKKEFPYINSCVSVSGVSVGQNWYIHYCTHLISRSKLQMTLLLQNGPNYHSAIQIILNVVGSGMISGEANRRQFILHASNLTAARDFSKLSA